MISRSGFSASDYKFFPGMGGGGYHARFKAIAKGWKKSHTGGYAKGRIYRMGNHVVAQSASFSMSSAE